LVSAQRAIFKSNPIRQPRSRGFSAFGFSLRLGERSFESLIGRALRVVLPDDCEHDEEG
jgi:hypothetical protein